MSFETRNNVSQAMGYIIKELSKGITESDLTGGYEHFSASTFNRAKTILLDRQAIESRTVLDGAVLYKIR